MDVLCWKGYDLRNTTREFRQYWLQTKIAEDNVCLVFVDDELHLVPLYSQKCTPASVMSAHSGLGSRVDEHSDGMLFYHDQSLYCGGSTPLVIVWKDASCSRYLIDGDPFDKQQILLRCDATSGAVFTQDQVALGVIDHTNFAIDTGTVQK